MIFSSYLYPFFISYFLIRTKYNVIQIMAIRAQVSIQPIFIFLIGIEKGDDLYFPFAFLLHEHSHSMCLLFAIMRVYNAKYCVFSCVRQREGEKIIISVKVGSFERWIRMHFTVVWFLFYIHSIGRHIKLNSNHRNMMIQCHHWNQLKIYRFC